MERSLAFWVMLLAALQPARSHEGQIGRASERFFREGWRLWGKGRACPDTATKARVDAQQHNTKKTYYGAPASFARVYDPSRGEGSFSILSYGSCGYTNRDGALPFPRDAVAAAADANPDYAGSCGRCYEVKCATGTVLGEQCFCVFWLCGVCVCARTQHPLLPQHNTKQPRQQPAAAAHRGRPLRRRPDAALPAGNQRQRDRLAGFCFVCVQVAARAPCVNTPSLPPAPAAAHTLSATKTKKHVKRAAPGRATPRRPRGCRRRAATTTAARCACASSTRARARRCVGGRERVCWCVLCALYAAPR